MRTRSLLLPIAAAGVAATTVIGASAAQAWPWQHHPGHHNASGTNTPIKHLVVLFDENVSFDHYFGTYPNATNTSGTRFTAARNTPGRINTEQKAHLLGKNPNLYPPFRLAPSQAATCDQNHSYLPEQKAVNGGRNDLYVQNTSVDTCTGLYGGPGLTMGYYDGNTVTALWNYAQHYAMSDNAYGSTFGPSTPGALNLIAGQTHGATAVDPPTLQPTSDSYAVADPDAQGVGTVVNDPDPAYDDCADKNHTSTNNLAAMSGHNIGDVLSAQGISWGWFQGGFAPTTAAGGGSTYAVCGAKHTNVAGASVADYSPHHNPFEYYQSTSNPHHLPPVSMAEVGHDGPANHQYDLSWFNQAATKGDLPAVSFVKAPEYQDGHAGYSDPIDEQHFLVDEMNTIEKSPDWKSTAIVVTYDDSDGWYDHQSATVLNGSTDTALNSAACQAGPAVLGGHQDRCGPGPRLPFLVISPYSKRNYVGHTQLEQTSVLKFIEHNWRLATLGDSSFDTRANDLTGLLDFRCAANARPVLLEQDGSVATSRRP